MKAANKKDKNIKGNEGDNLYGLLSSYKSCNTYFRILVNDDKNRIIIQITDNPKNWPDLDEEEYIDCKIVKRIEIGSEKMFVNYMSPMHLIEQVGPKLGIKLPDEKVYIDDNLEKSGNFSMETDLEFKTEVIQGLNKIINLTPQKKYEILEKSLSKEN